MLEVCLSLGDTVKKKNQIYIFHYNDSFFRINLFSIKMKFWKKFIFMENMAGKKIKW